MISVKATAPAASGRSMWSRRHGSEPIAHRRSTSGSRVLHLRRCSGTWRPSTSAPSRSCRYSASPSSSRTISILPGLRRPRPAVNSPTCPSAPPPSSRGSSGPAPFPWARPTWINSRLDSWARDHRTGSAATASIRTTCLGARAPAPRSQWRSVWQASRSVPIPQARDVYRPPSTTSWA
jgi:hypothetical protein